MYRFLIALLFVFSEVYASKKCPNGFTNAHDLLCVRYEKNYGHNFRMASSTCRSLGGELATIESGYQNTAIRDFVKKENWFIDTYVYIGLYYSSPSWKWISGRPVHYTNWYPFGQPNKFLNCVELSTVTAKWTSISCEKRMPYVCTADFVTAPTTSTTTTTTPKTTTLTTTTTTHRPTTTTVTTTTTTTTTTSTTTTTTTTTSTTTTTATTTTTTTTQKPASCPEGWKYFQFTNSCYRPAHTTSNWVESEADCQSRGGHLSSVHSSEENAFLTSLQGGLQPGECINGNGAGYWLGGFLNNKTGAWEWTDGTPFDFESFDTGSSGTENLVTGLSFVKGCPDYGLWEKIDSKRYYEPFYICKITM